LARKPSAASARAPILSRPSREPPRPDPIRMQRAVREFLLAVGLDPDSTAELGQTPALVARAWAEDFLDGYRSNPRDVLAERSPFARGKHDELVVLKGVRFQSVCPHHLLPYEGVAHVAYAPGRSVVGFGQIVKLLDCLGHRLILQEELARQTAVALREQLQARGAAVVLEAGQACMILRGGRRSGSTVRTEAYEGVFERDRELRERFHAAIQGG
jgi:GTP cyclohydrolase I